MCDQAYDLWQQLQLASELETDLQDTVDYSKKWLVDFNNGKSQLVWFDWSNNTGAINVKMDGSVLEEKSSLKMNFEYIFEFLNTFVEVTGEKLAEGAFLRPHHL